MITPLLTRRQAGSRATLPVPVTPDIACLQILFANVYLVGQPGGPWVLIDAGLPHSAARIRRVADDRYGAGSRPEAILLTHGHFDHVGALPDLIDRWNVPVYAHDLELPYLTGRSPYPPPDPTVGGGLMARLAYFYPRGPIDLDGLVRHLPADGTVPHLPGWRWIFTPGHSPGHVSFYRDADRALLAGDAFVTTKQESAWAVLTQPRRVHGPPAYYTPDWPAARDSVRRLSALNPDTAATGHGLPMSGPRLRFELERLARDFDALAIPRDGRYVRQSARADHTGVTYLPPPVDDPLPKTLAAALLLAGAAAALTTWPRHRRTS